MEIFKLGDVVARKSYNYDILFKVIGVNKDLYELAGLTVRIIADAPVYDLVHINDEEVSRRIKSIENANRDRINRSYSNINRRFNYRSQNTQNDSPNVYKKDNIYKKPGVILHIDGDAH